MSTSTPKSGQLNFLLDKKQCSMCKKVLPIKEFYLFKKNRDGRRSYCISCDTAKRRKSYKENPLNVTYKNLKDRAKKKNVPVEITFEYLKSIYPDDMICPALGIKMERGEENKNINSPSVDRIIPEKGYVPGNLIFVSMKANQIKTNATPDEIIKVGKFYKKLLEETEDGSKTD